MWFLGKEAIGGRPSGSLTLTTSTNFPKRNCEDPDKRDRLDDAHCIMTIDQTLLCNLRIFLWEDDKRCLVLGSWGAMFCS